MPTEGHSLADSRTSPAAGAYLPARRGSSRMLESYLGDIEYLMRERCFADAAPLALALPHLCAALAHPDLASSRDAYRDWCQGWVRPREADTSLAVPTPAELDALAIERGVGAELGEAPGVPTQALRQLRLRRLSRAAPARRRGAVPAADDAGDEAARDACVALLDAVRRWYHDCAARDAVVQTNLARLAVLR